MRISRLIFFVAFLACSISGAAQTSMEEIAANPDKAGGVYYAYPAPTEPSAIAAPKGYKPFYVSHYGRHGSRYLIGDQDYKWALDLLRMAETEGALTETGRTALLRLERVWPLVEGRGGDLSPIGEKQQRGIAERLYESYPEIFQGRKKVSARSTMSLRCAMSMAAFGDQLKTFNPRLQIRYEASERYVRYLNHHSDSSNLFANDKSGPWVLEYQKFLASLTKPARLMQELFSDDEFVVRRVRPDDLMWGLYWIAVDMQDIDTDVRFYDLFTIQELFDLWQCTNYRFYVGDANHAESKGVVVNNARPLVRNIIESADEAIRDGDIAATLRFGHDGNLIPLLALMQVENYGVSVGKPAEVYKVWANFKASPMAANLRLLFFKNKRNDILVRIQHNETDVHIPVETTSFPFYSWRSVRSYLESL